MRDFICITICILSLAGLFAHSMEKPESHVASPATKIIMAHHGVFGHDVPR
jgi:hypothetical protein